MEIITKLLFYEIIALNDSLFIGSIPTSPQTAAPKPKVYGLQNRSPAPFSPPAEPSKPATNSIWGSKNKEPEEVSKPATKSVWGSKNKEPEETSKPVTNSIWSSKNKEPEESSKPVTNSFWGSQRKEEEPSKPVTNSFWGSQKKEPEEPPQPSRYQNKKDSSFNNRYSAPEPAVVAPEPARSRYGATPGIVNKAKEGLAGSTYSRPEQKLTIVSRNVM